MRRIVNGLLYDTETATEIVPEGLIREWHPGSNSSAGFELWGFETLFQTKKGAYFRTYYAAANRESRKPEQVEHGDGGLYPLSDPDALKWCEVNKIDPDIIRKHFRIKEA